MFAWLLHLRPPPPLPFDVAHRRRIADVVLAHGEDAGMLAFRASRRRLSVIVRAERPRVGRFVHDLSIALRRALHVDAGFPCIARHGTSTDVRLLGRVLEVLHPDGVADDPWHDASSLPDTLGLRAIAPWLAPRLAAAIPAWAPFMAQPALGVVDLRPRFDADRLFEAALGASGLVDLADRSPRSVEVRAAAIQLAAPHVGVARAGALLGTSRSQAFRLAARTPSAPWRAAVAGQLSMRTSARARFPIFESPEARARAALKDMAWPPSRPGVAWPPPRRR